jgi:hypothetical protein
MCVCVCVCQTKEFLEGKMLCLIPLLSLSLPLPHPPTSLSLSLSLSSVQTSAAFAPRTPVPRHDATPFSARLQGREE